MYVCTENSTVYIGFGSIRGVRYPLGGLETYPLWMRRDRCTKYWSWKGHLVQPPHYVDKETEAQRVR